MVEEAYHCALNCGFSGTRHRGGLAVGRIVTHRVSGATVIASICLFNLLRIVIIYIVEGKKPFGR